MQHASASSRETIRMAHYMRVSHLSEQCGVNWLKTSPRHSQALTGHLLFASLIRICSQQVTGLTHLGDGARSSTA
jgi:hypothetical protein